MKKYIKICVVFCLFFMISGLFFLKHQSSKIIPIVFGIDDGYAAFVPVTVQSIKEHKNDKYLYKIFVLGTDITKEHKQMLEGLTQDNIEVSVIDIDSWIKNNKKLEALPLYYWMSPATYYRFFVAEILQDYEKVVYIDADSILTDDISKIYHIDLQGKMLGAAQQIPYISNRSEEWFKYCRERLKMQSPENYFNTGMLIMNLKKMREDNLREKAIDAMNTHRFDYMDQDTLNFLYSDDVLMLDPMYNAEVGLIRGKDKPIFIHFSSLFKPWKQSLPFKMDESVSSLFWGNSFMPQFWELAKKAPNYAEIVEIATQNHIEKIIEELNKCRSSQNEVLK